MASEYLRKSVADRRTGANLIGINVDTNNMRDLTPEFEMAFNQLEAFAKQTDEIKINSEKKKIQLEIEKSRLEFKDKYLSDPSVYSSQEKWDEVSRLYEEERKNAKKRIFESRYLSADEKALYSEDIDLDFKRSWLDPKLKRNSAVSQERIDEATMLFETAVNNACLDDLYNTDTIDKFIKRVDEIYNPLIESAISTKGDKNKSMIKGVSTIEGVRLIKKLESDILYNPMLSEEQKKAEISKAIETLKNPQRINDITESMSKEFGYDNYEKEYLKSSLKAQYENASIKLSKDLYNLEKDKKNLLEDNSKKIQEAYYKRNTSDYINYKYGVKNVSTSQLLNDEETLKLVTDIPAEDFGDSKKGLAFPFITDGINTALNGQIAGRKKNPNYTLDEVYKPIYDFATENCGEKAGYVNRRKALIIDYALKNGIEPDILLKGENNPDYFKVSNIMSIGSQENKDNLNIGNLIEDKGEFNKLSMAFSPIKSVGDLMATNYILGKAKARGQEDMLLEFPELGLKKLMRNIPAEEYIREIKIAKEITLNRTPYRYVNYNEKIEGKKEILVPKNAKQSEMFGG